MSLKRGVIFYLVLVLVVIGLIATSRDLKTNSVRSGDWQHGKILVVLDRG